MQVAHAESMSCELLVVKLGADLNVPSTESTSMELRYCKLVCKETFPYIFPRHELAEDVLANWICVAFIQHLMLHEFLQYLL